MDYLITISTIILLIPLNIVLLNNLIFQLKKTYRSPQFKSTLYTLFLVVTVAFVTYLIFAILGAETVSDNTGIVI